MMKFVFKMVSFALKMPTELTSYVTLLSGTVIEASKRYNNTIVAMDACGGRRKTGGDSFIFEFMEESSCPHPCSEVVQVRFLY